MDIKNELQYFRYNNIRIKIIDLPTTMLDLPSEHSWVIDMVNNILIEVLSSLAEQEYHNIHLRQREGIEAAKLKGTHLGRPPLLKHENWDIVIAEYKAANITAKQAMTVLNLKKSSLYKMLKAK